MPVLDNPRHERFAQELAKGEPASTAYVNAGYSANEGNCIRLKGNERIKARVAEIQGAAADEVICTVHDIARQLDEDRQFARENVAASAAIAATMGKAKVLGLMIEKHELTGKDGGPMETVDMTPTEIGRRIAFTLARAVKPLSH